MKRMIRTRILRTLKRRTIDAASFALVVLLGATWHAQGQTSSAPTAYSKMAPVEEYLMADRDGEIALARTAAPESISQDADVMVLGRHGYETAVKGKNGFVCMVERSWTAGLGDPNFWNPKLRAPICFNPPAVRSYLRLTMKKTELVLADPSADRMFDAIKAGLDKKELPAPEPGAMSYMLSKQGYLGDGVGHWHPHIMLFVPPTDDQTWGANLPGSPVLTNGDPEDRLTVVLIPVRKWSDGTADQPDAH
jgi:hypothetical protein